MLPFLDIQRADVDAAAVSMHSVHHPVLLRCVQLVDLPDNVGAFMAKNGTNYHQIIAVVVMHVIAYCVFCMFLPGI